MGKRGPQPKPQTIKEIEGNPGKRSLNKSALVATGKPSCPGYLSDHAKEVWQTVVGSMPPSLYASCDSFLLASYCTAVDMHRQAIEGISEEGAVATGQNGAPYQNPWISILNKQAQLLATLGGRLGLDPAARNSLNLPIGEEKKSKFADLIPITGGRKEL